MLNQKALYRICCAFGFALLVPSAHAQTSFGTTHLIGTAGVTYGGDAWAVAKAGDGSPVNIRAGGVVQVGAGVLWDAPTWPMSASLTANYHYTNAAGQDGRKASFSRFPIEAIAYYTGMEKLRFGLGLRSALSPSVSIDNVPGQGKVTLASGKGKLVEIGYAVTPQAWLNIRVVSEKFDPAYAGGERGDVSHLGINLSYKF